ncbi:MAG TPA: tetratricopeptide repeat protein [Steroidobacteraceae bacterium]|nr:tetratricopeptide repeat protein [Steroidobacteraceae bacterium]
MKRAAGARCAPLLAGAALLACAASALAAPPPATIKDLENRRISVEPDQPHGVNLKETMRSYQRFLDLNAGDAELRAEALRRLGDLHLQSSIAANIERELAANEALQAAEAIMLYSALLKTYPDYRRNDAVLYQLARAYEFAEQPDKALAALDRLVSQYPHCRYVDEAQFRRGELLFSAKQYRDAQRAYEAAIRFGPESEFYSQSEYKLGWSLFKQGENVACLDSFAAVLDGVLIAKGDPSKMIDADTLSRPNRELVNDTFRVMSIAFSYQSGPQTIDAFLQHIKPPPYAYLFYARLGDLYMKKQRYTDAADSYRAFVARDPRSEKAPLLQMRAIDAYARGGFPQLVLRGKREFVDDYAFGAAYWQGRDPAQEPGVVNELKASFRDLAQYYHAQAQHTKNAADYQTAANWYRRFLSAFPNDSGAAQTNFALADTLFESKQYLLAAQQYEHTAYGYGKQPQAAAAGYAAIVAYDKQAEASSGADQAAVRRQSVDSALRFADAFPQNPQSAQVLAHAVTTLYDDKEYARATAAARKLLALQPPVDAGKQRIAWTVIADSAFAQGAYDTAESAYAAVKALLPADDPQRPAIIDRLAASIYKQGEQKNEAGDGAAAVADFLRVSELAPTSKIRANADYDAAALLIRQKEWQRAIGVLQDLRRNFPKSPLQEDVTRKLAVAYSASNRPAEAAGEFASIAASPSESFAVRRDATLQAANLYGTAGNTKKSRAMLEAYVDHYPEPLDPAMGARNKLRSIAAQEGDRRAETHWLRQIIAVDRAAGAARTDRSRALAARATMTLAAPLRDAFDRIKLVAPLNRSLAEKRRTMQAALRAYSAAADYQVVGVTTAATFESAELYRQLAEDLRNSQRPKNLSKDELAEYDVLLGEQALPFEEQAIKLHEVNTARAQQGIYDQWVRKSYAALAKLDPARYDKVEIGEQLVDAIR